MMNRPLSRLVLPAAALAAGLALAAVVVPAQAQQASGEVTKVDKAGGRVTIRHAGVPQLDMPPMASTFRVRDPKWLDSVATGDRVRFTVEKVDGSFTITSLSKG